MPHAGKEGPPRAGDRPQLAVAQSTCLFSAQIMALNHGLCLCAEPKLSRHVPAVAEGRFSSHGAVTRAVMSRQWEGARYHAPIHHSISPSHAALTITSLNRPKGDHTVVRFCDFATRPPSYCCALLVALVWRRNSMARTKYTELVPGGGQRSKLIYHDTPGASRISRQALAELLSDQDT